MHKNWKLIAPLTICLAAFGCGEGGSGSGSAVASSSGASSAKPAASSKPTSAPTTAAAKPTSVPTASSSEELVETDLSPRGDEWKGFTIKAPKDAKVMDDLGDCRVATKGFDVVLSQKKNKADIAQKKKALEDLAKQVKGKVTFKNETAEGFDYTFERPKMDKPDEMFASDDFFMIVKVGGKNVGCFPHDSAMGDEIEKARTACKTVAKK
ncbi:MAG: hypothetical protein HOW73_30735 [Polyangiaceae bacterium]|nr:hypothetical protein [Polyangiaceae bacterium]